MTPQEFKAWFDGFTEAMDGHPTEAQWVKVKQRVSEIDGKPISYPVYVDRYWPRDYPRWYEPYRVYGASSGMSAAPTMGANTLAASMKVDDATFDSLPAMKALGAADYSLVS